MTKFIPTYIGNIDGKTNENTIKLKYIFSQAGIPTEITKEINTGIIDFLTVLIPLTAAAIHANCSFENLLKDKNIIKIGIRAVREAKIIFKRKSIIQYIPVNLMNIKLKTFLFLTKSISKPLIENYTREMKEQTKLILKGFLEVAEECKYNSPNILFLSNTN